MKSAFGGLYSQIAFLALLYIIAGKLGLMLAVPPGYATVIWPPSGIAIGTLLIYGRQLWPGIFIGSFLLNAGALDLETPSAWSLTLAALIATGSTLQALAGHFLTKRLLGLPLSLANLKQLFLLFLLTGPVACLIASTTGAASLYFLKSLPWEEVFRNWITWWTGDILGVVIFLPPLLLAPGSLSTWRGHPLGTLPILGMLLLMIPLGLTFYLWKITTERLYERNRTHFETLVEESQNSLLFRFKTYDQALVGAAGLFSSSDHVSAEEWGTYIQSIDLPANYPGINSLGLIRNVPSKNLKKFIQEQQAYHPGFSVYPATGAEENFIVTYIEPDIHKEALGWNISSEPKRYEAALAARDSGKTAITKRIRLLHDTSKSAGFLMLHPIYATDLPLATPEERSKALIGWIHAPFNIDTLMGTLNPINSQLLNIKIYEGNAPVYSSPPGEDTFLHEDPLFTVEREVPMFQKKWKVAWTSSAAFEDSVYSAEPLIICVGGITFTLMFAIFLVMVIHRDRTIQELVNSKTKEIYSNEQKLKLLIQYTPAAVAMFDRNMEYIMSSQRWISEYGLENVDIIGKSHYDIFPEIRNKPDWLDIHQRALNGEAFHKDEDFLVRENGRTEWIRYDIHPWHDASGAIGGIIMFTEVITERKKMVQALRASEETFRSAMEASSIGIALLHPDGRWMKVNHALCSYLGYSEQELLDLDFQSITFSDDLGKDIDNVKSILAGDIDTYTMEKRYIHKNGQVLWAILSVTLVRNEDGSPKYFISQVNDITELKEVERLKDEFISIVSHELRTPVTSINLALILLEENVPKDEGNISRTYIDLALRNCERLIFMLNDILDLKKMSVGKMDYHFTEENLGDLVRQAVEDNRSYGARYGVTFKITDFPSDAVIRVDARRLHQVLTNFFSNAAKFTSKGDTILVYGMIQNSVVRVCVEDHGQGIPLEFHARIFQKFSQADFAATRKQEGTGLGLHISKEIVENMGGKIGFESDGHKGSIFWFEFPLLG